MSVLAGCFRGTFQTGFFGKEKGSSILYCIGIRNEVMYKYEWLKIF